ncbi:hypothetical protein EVG20_g3676 [Dentipellis fragilis]|uniref:NEDD8-activating enzyme E1 regulatory subunit n=1 Tax=Dentipellis fragilis TaxID=205917 RepID=A0A4Y9Z0H5_9AGAM|nr:hypothetical protein EVG20_g3676 [Dentipellis fragilis]
MAPGESQDIEVVTTAIHAQPDNKTRRYDRQLRLWAATGQHALETSRILVLSSSATSTSIMKNLVLPGIGHFTLLDPTITTARDAGNNFFLAGPDSIGKHRAQEAVPLLGELNDGVEGTADVRSVHDVLESDPAYFKSFSLVISHNLDSPTVEKLSRLLWTDPLSPPLIVVRSAGFLADFYIQFHEHDIIESHTETAPSLRIDKPFPSLLGHALSLELANMDITDHGHIPYVVILVRVLEDWKRSHNGLPPQNYAEKQAFKAALRDLKRKPDEENFDEAEAQAYRAWTTTGVPSDVAQLFTLPAASGNSTPNSTFHTLLHALQKFTELDDPPHVLPLSSTLPDMKADTSSYVHLQTLYKTRADEERAIFFDLLDKNADIDEGVVETFVKNAHAIRVLRGRRWGEFDADKEAIASAVVGYPRESASHFALSALSNLTSGSTAPPTADALLAEVQRIVGPGIELPEKELTDAIGELARAPTSDLPNVAAFLGGLVAQEAIKIITKQYVPINGYCVVDLVDTWTGVVGTPA